MHPWDQMASESVAAYKPFLSYRNLGPTRSIPQVVPVHYGIERTPATEKNYQSKLRTLRHFSTSYDWVDRVNAYDVWVLQERAVKREVDARDMNDRHAALGQKVMSVAEKFVDEILLDEDRLVRMSPRDALAYFEIAARVERISRGEPAETVSLTDSAESVLDRMKADPESQRLHTELVQSLSRRQYSKSEAKKRATRERNGTTTAAKNPKKNRRNSPPRVKALETETEAKTETET